MSIQITSLAAGSSMISPQQEIQQEKRPPLPAEEKAEEKLAEASLPAGKKSNAQDLRQTTLDLERISMAFDRRLKFIVDQESREILVKVIDNETDKVIKVLPPEELQRLHSRIRETIGFLFDTMV